MENPKHTFRETNFVLQLMQESQIKSKTVLRWNSPKKKEGIFCTVYFLTFVFYRNVQWLEYTFGIYILLHIKKHYFINFCCLFLKSLKAFSVSLNRKITQKFIRKCQIVLYHLKNTQNNPKSPKQREAQHILLFSDNPII